MKFSKTVNAATLLILLATSVGLEAQEHDSKQTQRVTEFKQAHARGGFAYVANRGADNVSAFLIDGDTGALTLGTTFQTTFPAEREPISVVATTKFVFVADAASGEISVYNIHQPTGSLTQIAGSPFDARGGTQFLMSERTRTVSLRDRQ